MALTSMLHRWTQSPLVQDSPTVTLVAPLGSRGRGIPSSSCLPRRQLGQEKPDPPGRRVSCLGVGGWGG